MKNKLKGGKLCLDENIDNDIYTKWYSPDRSFTTIWLEAEGDGDKIIKLVHNTTECENARIMAEKFTFVPRYYGCYKCNKIYTGGNKPPIYLVMEKINGVSLDPGSFVDNDEIIENKVKKLEQYFPEIYEKYLLVCKEGVLLNDLYCRNIIINDKNEVIFIDFDDTYTKIYEEEVEPMSSEDLFQKLSNDLKGLSGGKLSNKKKRKTKRRHKKRNGSIKTKKPTNMNQSS